MKALLVWLTALFVANCTAYSQEQVVLYDGLSNVVTNECKVRDATEVHRSPIFDNAPFLRLRKDDKLIKAREVIHGKPLADPDRFCYYLFSDGKYYRLWASEENGRLITSSRECSILFEWDVTMPNAKALRDLFSNYNKDYSHSLTIGQYEAIIAAVGPQFPAVKFRYALPEYDLAPSLKPDRVVRVPGAAFVEFQGIAYNVFQNAIYRYWIRIGPTICSITGEVLAQGPGHVGREEFEGHHETYASLNGPGNYDIDPKVAKVKKAQYDEMGKFQKLVIGGIQSGASTP